MACPPTPPPSSVAIFHPIGGGKKKEEEEGTKKSGLVEKRGRDIGALFARRVLNPESNVSFGEGGAGPIFHRHPLR